MAVRKSMIIPWIESCNLDFQKVGENVSFAKSCDFETFQEALLLLSYSSHLLSILAAVSNIVPLRMVNYTINP